MGMNISPFCDDRTCGLFRKPFYELFYNINLTDNWVYGSAVLWNQENKVAN